MRNASESSSDCECSDCGCTCRGLRHVRGELMCLNDGCQDDNLSGWEIANLIEEGLIRASLIGSVANSYYYYFDGCIDSRKFYEMRRFRWRIRNEYFLNPRESISEREYTEPTADWINILQGTSYEPLVPELPDRTYCLERSIIDDYHRFMADTSCVCLDIGRFNMIQGRFRDTDVHVANPFVYNCYYSCLHWSLRNSCYDIISQGFGPYVYSLYRPLEYEYSVDYAEVCSGGNAKVGELEFGVDQYPLPYTDYRAICDTESTPNESSDIKVYWDHPYGEDVYASFELGYDWMEFIEGMEVYARFVAISEGANIDRRVTYFTRKVDVKQLSDSSSSTSSSSSSCPSCDVKKIFVIKRDTIAKVAKNIGLYVRQNDSDGSGGTYSVAVEFNGACVVGCIRRKMDE